MGRDGNLLLALAFGGMMSCAGKGDWWLCVNIVWMYARNEAGEPYGEEPLVR